jgi:hypothetical protein
MDTILEPLLAILVIVIPIGLAYVILFLQANKPACGGRKVSAVTRNDLLLDGTELSRAEKKQAVRLISY